MPQAVAMEEGSAAGETITVDVLVSKPQETSADAVAAAVAATVRAADCDAEETASSRREDEDGQKARDAVLVATDEESTPEESEPAEKPVGMECGEAEVPESRRRSRSPSADASDAPPLKKTMTEAEPAPPCDDEEPEGKAVDDAAPLPAAAGSV